MHLHVVGSVTELDMYKLIAEYLNSFVEIEIYTIDEDVVEKTGEVFEMGNDKIHSLSIPKLTLHKT